MWAGTSDASYNPHKGNLPSANFTQGVDVVPAVGRPPYYLGANALNPVLNEWNGFILEVVGTAFLVSTVLTTAVDQRSLQNVNALAPLPIGFAVFVVHLALVPWTGCGIVRLVSLVPPHSSDVDDGGRRHGLTPARRTAPAPSALGS